MRKPTAVIDLDVTQPLTFPDGLDRYTEAAVLWRVRQRPLGLVRAPVVHGRVVLEHAIRELLEKLTAPCGVALAERAIASGRPPCWPDAGVLRESWMPPLTSGPTISLVIGTTGRGANLQRCLDAVRAIGYQSIDPVVIEHASTGDVAVRRRAIRQSTADIVAFIDDDMEVDRHWVSSIVRAFLADPEVMVVTGPVIPREVATPSRLFDDFPASDGFRRRWSRGRIDQTASPAGNIAFWRSAFDAPDVVTWVNEPSAIVRGARGHNGDVSPRGSARGASEAIRRVDLADAVRPVADAMGFDQLKLAVSWGAAPLGRISIDHQGAVVSTAWITDVIAQDLTVAVLDAQTRLGEHVLWATVTSTLGRALLPAVEASRREGRRRWSQAA